MARPLRAGIVAELLSTPLLVGYLAGGAVLMVVGQLAKVTGTSFEGDTIIEDLERADAIARPVAGSAGHRLRCLIRFTSSSKCSIRRLSAICCGRDPRVSGWSLRRPVQNQGWAAMSCCSGRGFLGVATETDWLTITVAASTLAVILLLRWLVPSLPGPLIAVVAALTRTVTT